jgi:hypothetical protein
VAFVLASSVPKSLSADTRTRRGLHRDGEDGRVVSGRHPVITHVRHVVTCSDERLNEPGREVVVEKQPHALWPSGSSRSRTASAA